MIFKDNRLKRSTSEASLQIKVLAYLRSREDVCVYRIQAASTRGVPDILCCYKGKFIAIELKSLHYINAKMSANQVQCKKKIEACGGVFICARTLGDVERALEAIDTLG